MNWNLPRSIKGSVQDNRISIVREAETRSVKALHGLSRSLLHNMVLGVSEGFATLEEVLRIAYDMVREKLMTAEHAVKSGDPQALDHRRPCRVPS